MSLLTGIEPVERQHLDDTVLAIEWSSTDRMMALGADGRASITGAERLTAPVGPDPIACAWMSPERVAVVDGLLGVVVAGRAPTGVVTCAGQVGVAAPSPEADDTIACRQHVVVAGRAGVSVVHANSRQIEPPTVISTGPIRSLVHLGGSIWLAGGSAGLVVVDVALGCVDQRVDLPSIVALASAPAAGRVAAADASGAIHVLAVADLEHGTELTGYPDAVRHLGIDPTGDVVIAAADDELTWWSVDARGRSPTNPTRASATTPRSARAPSVGPASWPRVTSTGPSGCGRHACVTSPSPPSRSITRSPCCRGINTVIAWPSARPTARSSSPT